MAKIQRLSRWRRRRVLAALLAFALPPARAQHGPAAAGEARVAPYAPVLPGYRIRFPQDEGSHPAFRTEWWYITGWLQRANRARVGFQITFFRVRTEVDERNPSAFTPRQLMIAHGALSDAARGRLIHDQKVARAALGRAGADEGRTRVWIDDWSLTQDALSYRLRAPAREFSFDFTFSPSQAPLLQGENGYSQKGPRPESASYYYSIPHLRVGGSLVAKGERSEVVGDAWLDHEWSSSYMDERASGWDWVGINLADGGAFMAFRMRLRSGGVLWASATYRRADGLRQTFGPRQVEFTSQRTWRSGRTGTSYPVAWRITAGPFDLVLEPLMDDQEHDTRASVGTVYWEGAVTALAAGRPVGQGYLELTGYWQPMKL